MTTEKLEITFKPLDDSVMKLIAYLCRETDENLEEVFARLLPATMMAAQMVGIDYDDLRATVSDLEPKINEALDMIEQRGIEELEKMEAAGMA